ncbi:MAG TPA: alpha/beta hydrolase [Gemmatimonadaceae bacterium]
MIAALVALGLLLGLVGLLWQSQERVLFQPPRSHEIPPETGRASYKAADGQPLSGFIIGDPETAPGVLLCFHGNADLAMWQLEWARAVEARSGYAVMLAEYRGYMSLGGTPTYSTTKLDALAAYAYLESAFGLDGTRMAYFGHSLGSAIAVELAEARQPRALLLQSPFSSARAMARLIVTPPVAAIWRAISRIHFDTIRVVSRLAVPVSVTHGKRDRIVPFRMGLDVYDAARKKGQLLVVDKAGHSDVAEVAGEEYWKWLITALEAQT